MARPRRTTPTPPPRCPRCAYDLAGAVALWKDSCDLHGVCPECGLDFPWRDVMNPMHVMPRWFFENPVRSPVFSFITTLTRILSPRRFWSSINIALPIHARRLAVMLAVVLLATHVLLTAGAAYTSSRTIRPYIVNPAYAISPPAKDIYARVLIWPYRTREAQVTQTYVVSGGALTAYGPGSPAGLTRRTYTFPIQLRSAADNGIAAAVLPFLLMPLTYLILRQTLRKTRVRPLHLFRVFAYSVVLLVPLLAFQFLLSENPLSSGTPWAPGPRGFLGLGIELPDLGPGWLVMLAAELIVLALWWRAATTRYLRLPHANGVVLAMVTITALVTSLWLVFSLGGSLFRSW
jgi:hypothetical protein